MMRRNNRYSLPQFFPQYKNRVHSLDAVFLWYKKSHPDYNVMDGLQILRF